MTKNKAG